MQLSDDCLAETQSSPEAKKVSKQGKVDPGADSEVIKNLDLLQSLELLQQWGGPDLNKSNVSKVQTSTGASHAE